MINYYIILLINQYGKYSMYNNEVRYRVYEICEVFSYVLNMFLRLLCKMCMCAIMCAASASRGTHVCILDGDGGGGAPISSWYHNIQNIINYNLQKTQLPTLGVR